MSQHNKRTFGPSTEIDDKAKIAFQSAVCLPQFVVRPWSPDTFLDYKLESLVSGEPTGQFAFIQLKGQGKIKISKDQLSYPLAAKQLRYYAEKIREPVFLVVVDIQTGVGYFLFVQAWLDAHSGKKVLNQKTVTLNIPALNTLSDKALFRTRVSEALDYMRRKYPGTVQDAIAAEIAAYQHIDPRFNVGLKTDGLKTHVQFTAKEPVNLALTVSLPTDTASQEKLQKLLKFGQPAKFQDAVVNLTGSPLFSQLQGNAKVARLAISPSKSTDCEFIIFNKEGGLLMACMGKITHGIEGITFTFTGEAPPIPLRLMIEVSRQILTEGGGTVCQFGWDFTQWVHVPVRQLKFFNPTLEFSGYLTSQESLKAEFRIDGDCVAASVIGSTPPTDRTLCTHLILDCIAKLRTISSASGTEIKVPVFTEFTPETIGNIYKAHDLFTTGEHIIRAQEMVIQGNFELLSGESAPNASDDSDYSPLTISPGPQQLSILGNNIPMGPLTYIFERAKMKVVSATQSQQGNSVSDRQVEFFTESGSTLRILRDTKTQPSVPSA